MADAGTRAIAHNALSAAMHPADWWLPLSERERLANAVLDAVEPLIRRDDAVRVMTVAKDFPEPFRSIIVEALAEVEPALRARADG